MCDSLVAVESPPPRLTVAAAQTVVVLAGNPADTQARAAGSRDQEDNKEAASVPS